MIRVLVADDRDAVRGSDDPDHERSWLHHGFTIGSGRPHDFAKLDCRDRAALVALAYETGVVVPGEAG